MTKKAKNLPPKPLCGSIEQNKMIRAINDGEENPCKQNEKCRNFWKGLEKEKAEHPGAYFSLVEPDGYEESLLEQLLP